MIEQNAFTTHRITYFARKFISENISPWEWMSIFQSWKISRDVERCSSVKIKCWNIYWKSMGSKEKKICFRIGEHSYWNTVVIEHSTIEENRMMTCADVYRSFVNRINITTHMSHCRFILKLHTKLGLFVLVTMTYKCITILWYQYKNPAVSIPVCRMISSSFVWFFNMFVFESGDISHWTNPKHWTLYV